MFNPKSVNAFVILADSKTFAEAADKLHITQPALSTSIKKLEEQLGGRLFSRNTRNVSLTVEGRIFIPDAKRLLLDWSNSLADMQNLFSIQQGTLTIAAMPSFAEGPLSALLRPFLQQFPNIKIRILDVVMEEVIERVLSGQAEIGFSFAPELNDGLHFDTLFTDTFVAVVGPQHEFTQQQQVSWQDMFSQPFVAMNRQSSVRRWLEKIAKQCDTAFNVVAEANQLGTVGHMVASDIGVSIVPALCRAQMTAKGVSCISLTEPLINRPVGMLTSTRGSLSVAAEEFKSSIIQSDTAANYLRR